MNTVPETEKFRIKLILNYVNMFTLFFSVLYSIMLIWSYYFDSNTDFPPLFLSILIPGVFLFSYYLNIKNYYRFSKTITLLTILIINFVMGIKWGFDLPSVLISYLFCIIIVALTSQTKENVFYVFGIIVSIFTGNYLHNTLNGTITWYGSGLYINDILEFSVMFIFITFILIRFNREQNKTLNRAIRTENILRKERDGLEKLVEKKTQEIKQIQMEELSKIYHLIEFSKLSSGLYHDLMTPIQTMNLYIEKLTEENLIKENKFSKIIFNMKNTHEKLVLMIQNIKKQISLKTNNEKFNLIDEVQDIINLVKNNYLKDGVSINFEYQDKLHLLDNKKFILNHIILNMISNAYEACIQDRTINNKDEYLIQIIVGKNKNKTYISIVDNGIGIKDECLNKIFNDFYSSKDKNNCGIGLSSAKHYAEKYLNGKILVESEYGSGTTMTIVF